MVPKPISAPVAAASSATLIDCLALVMPIDTFSSIRQVLSAIFTPSLPARVRLPMDQQPKLTPGFRATVGAWPSVVTAANISAGTTRRCRCLNGQVNSGEYLSLTSLFASKRINCSQRSILEQTLVFERCHGTAGEGGYLAQSATQFLPRSLHLAQTSVTFH